MGKESEFLDRFVQELPGEGIYRLHRSVFTDAELFDLEMRHIFEGGWVYLAHESQLPDPFSFITTHIGRHSVIVNRDKDGQIGGFINTCQHRGALVEQLSRGKRKVFTCPFHGWGYAANGTLLSCGDSEDHPRYSEHFDKASLGLAPIAKVESYRGFIFGSLNADVPTLEEHLGEAGRCIDAVVDQHPEGKLEVLTGRQSYTFEGNWKLQAENGVDGYHVGAIHANYVQTVMNRQKIRAEHDDVKSMDASRLGTGDLRSGYYAFENGHVVLWSEWANPEARPAWPQRQAFVDRLGESAAEWMTGFMRNLLIYPNLFLMDQMSSQIRTFRPLSVNRTEVNTFCIAPVGEGASARRHRIRQYEDFFNASGMATPDDLAAFNASQAGFEAREVEWNDLSRGAADLIEGPDDLARGLDIAPLYTGRNIEDEGIYLNQHRRWQELLENGVATGSRHKDRGKNPRARNVA